jgi:hypothetical protein
MLATLREPPPRGSIKEALLQALIVRRDQIEYTKTRALVQAFINHEEAQKGLDTYRDALFPYFQKQQKDQRQSHIQRLIAEVSRGPLSVTPIEQRKARSKLKTRIVERSKDEAVEATRRLSKRIGGYV